MSAAVASPLAGNHQPTLIAADMQFDVVISGGGMTGAVLALLLKQQQPALRLAVIEQQSLQQQVPASSFDSRSIALSAASVELLQQAGLWQALKPHACPIEQIHVSDRGHFGKARLQASDYQRSALGYVIEIEHIGAVVYQQLAALAEPVQWFRPASISRINPPTEPDWRTLQLTDGTLLQTRLLVLAEGGDSPGRQLAGIEVLQQDYQQTALIANIAIHGSHQNRAFERFTADGPLALLPLSSQPLSSQQLSQPSLSQQPLSQQQAREAARYSLVWTLAPAEAQRLQQCPPTQFLAELQRAFGYRAGEFSQVGNRVCYPLALKRAKQASSHRLVLCGNSLHSLHPIAGQGFNLALRDIAALVSLIGMQADAGFDTGASVDAGLDAGSYALVRQYAQLREADMATVITFTDSMVRLFSNQSRLMALGRNLALSQLNHCSALKALFAGQSMGLTPLAQQQRSLLQYQQRQHAMQQQTRLHQAGQQQANQSMPEGSAVPAPNQTTGAI